MYWLILFLKITKFNKLLLGDFFPKHHSKCTKLIQVTFCLNTLSTFQFTYDSDCKVL